MVMSTRLRLAVAALSVALLGVQAGCRVQKTRGQRRQVQAISTVLQAEGQRLTAQDSHLAAAIDVTEQEMDLYRSHGDSFGYVFYLAQGPLRR